MKFIEIRCFEREESAKKMCLKKCFEGGAALRYGGPCRS